MVIVDKNSYLRKITSTFVLITFFVLIFSNVSLLSVAQSKEALEEDSDLSMLLDSDLIGENPLLIPNSDNNDTVFGEGVHLTPSDLQRDYYASALGTDGRLHCIWIQQHTQHGFSLFYSFSNCSDGINWSVSKLLYRFEEEILYPDLTVDNNDNLHIVLAIKRDTYSRVYYLNYTASNSLSSLVPVFCVFCGQTEQKKMSGRSLLDLFTGL